MAPEEGSCGLGKPADDPHEGQGEPRGQEDDGAEAASDAGSGSTSSSSELVNLEPVEPWYGPCEGHTEQAQEAALPDGEESVGLDRGVLDTASQEPGHGSAVRGESLAEVAAPAAPEGAAGTSSASRSEAPPPEGSGEREGAGPARDFEAGTTSLLSFYLGPSVEVDLGLRFKAGDRCRWPVLEVKDRSWGRAHGIRARDELFRINSQDTEALQEEEVCKALAKRPLTFSFARQSSSTAGLISTLACLHVEQRSAPVAPSAATAGHRLGGREGEAKASAAPKRSARLGEHECPGQSSCEAWRPSAVSKAVCPAHLALPGQRGGRLRWAGLGLLDEELPNASALPSIGVRADGVKELDLSKNKLTGTFLPRLLSPCRCLAALRTVKLFANALGDGSAAFLAQLCLHCPVLLEMHLSHNLLTARGVREIVPAACRGTAQRRALVGARGAPPPFWLRLEHNAIDEPGRLLELWRVDRLPVCRLQRGCSSACCRTGMELHLPYFSIQGRDLAGGEVNRPPPSPQFPTSRPTHGWSAVFPPKDLYQAVRRSGQGLGQGRGSGKSPGRLRSPSPAASGQRSRSGGHHGSAPSGMLRASSKENRSRPALHYEALRERATPLVQANGFSRDYAPKLEWHREPAIRSTETQVNKAKSPPNHVSHVGSCGLLGEKPASEPTSVPAAPEPRTVVHLPRAAAFLSEEQLPALIHDSGKAGLEHLREQHPMCRIDLESTPMDGHRARPAFVVRPAAGVDSQAGPVATCIAMGKAVRDVEHLVEAMRPLLSKSSRRPQSRPRGVREEAGLCQQPAFGEMAASGCFYPAAGVAWGHCEVGGPS